MRRESHVRSCESGRGRFPPATHPIPPGHSPEAISGETPSSANYRFQPSVRSRTGTKVDPECELDQREGARRAARKEELLRLAYAQLGDRTSKRRAP